MSLSVSKYILDFACEISLFCIYARVLFVQPVFKLLEVRLACMYPRVKLWELLLQ